MVKTAGAGEVRRVETPNGPLTYTLRRKRVKNLNLRVGQDRSVTLSVPIRCSGERADAFVREKSGWIVSTLTRIKQAPQEELLPEPSRAECEVLLAQALERVWPLVEPLGVPMPKLKLRSMRSQWGNCHWQQGYITLNTALGRCPAQLRDYVALHELVHFLHHDHGAGFYAAMDGLMPDWRARRQKLRRCSGALVPQSEGDH